MTEGCEGEASSDPVVAMPRLVRGGSRGGCAKAGPHAAPVTTGAAFSLRKGAMSQGAPPWVSAAWLMGATWLKRGWEATFFGASFPTGRRVLEAAEAQEAESVSDADRAPVSARGALMSHEPRSLPLGVHSDFSWRSLQYLTMKAWNESTFSTSCPSPFCASCASCHLDWGDMPKRHDPKPRKPYKRVCICTTSWSNAHC